MGKRSVSTHTCVLICEQLTNTRTCAHTHTHTHTHTKVRTHLCTHYSVQTHQGVGARAHTQTHTHTPRCTHTHTHTPRCTHTQHALLKPMFPSLSVTSSSPVPWWLFPTSSNGALHAARPPRQTLSGARPLLPPLPALTVFGPQGCGSAGIWDPRDPMNPRIKRVSSSRRSKFRLSGSGPCRSLASPRQMKRKKRRIFP